MCADVCKDTQHSCYSATTALAVKRFLLLRNIIFIVRSMRITKSKQAPADSTVICFTKHTRNAPRRHKMGTRLRAVRA